MKTTTCRRGLSSPLLHLYSSPCCVELRLQGSVAHHNLSFCKPLPVSSSSSCSEGHTRRVRTQESAREMGSLMAGWDSPVLADDDKKVHARRNRSLTKEEVEAFWKQRRSRRSEDGGDLASPPATATESPFGRSEKPAAVRVDGFLPAAGSGDDDAADSPSWSRDWWTRSSWAFLNEPPQEEPSARAQRYTPQFHVARIATTGNA